MLVAAQLGKTRIESLTSTIALTAADVGLEYGLAIADSIVYATATTHGVELATSDGDFASLPGVLLLTNS